MAAKWISPRGDTAENLKRQGGKIIPVPTYPLSSDEFSSTGQTPYQRKVEKCYQLLVEKYRAKLGLSRRSFLQSACGMAAAFLAMNMVYDQLFAVDAAEAADPEAAASRLQQLADQFIFDVQLHYVRDEYSWKGLLGLRQNAAKWNPDLVDDAVSLDQFKFDNFLREVFLKSDTTLGLLSGAPSDKPERWFLKNDEIAEAREIINSVAGSKRIFSHAIFTPGQPGWLEEVDRAIEELKPDSWKGYTIGDPLGPSRYPWRLDDEKLVYPAYEKMDRAGIRNICIHKGLLPDDFENSFPGLWQYAGPDDIGKAAKDWPQLNFIIYHSAIRPIQRFSQSYINEFEKSGYIPWVTELSRIPEKYGVDNVYGELGTAFATSAVTWPRHCAALLGILIKGLSVTNVLWGTDSVWYGSPQWQIEAFRRMEIPEDMRNRFGFASLGDADGQVKKAIFGLNSARLYDVAVNEKGVYSKAADDRFSLLLRN